MNAALKKRLLESLYTNDTKATPDEEESYLYALVDASHDGMIASTLQGLASNVRLIMQGEDLEEFGDESPWLVQIKPEENLLDWLLENGWGERWLVFLRSRYSMNVLLEHLQHFVSIVNDESGEELYFRFYDPIILFSHLLVFTQAQRDLFFRKIDHVLMEIGDTIYLDLSYPESNEGAIQKQLVESTDAGITVDEGQFSLPNLNVENAQAEPVFIFSKEQLEYPILSNRPLLIDHIEEYLRESYDTRMNCYPKGFLYSMIDHGIELAFSYRLFDLEHVRLFSELRWEIAPGFHRQPDIHAVLSDDVLSSKAKFNYMTEDRFTNAWMKAMEYDDSNEWLEEEKEKEGYA